MTDLADVRLSDIFDAQWLTEIGSQYDLAKVDFSDAEQLLSHLVSEQQRTDGLEARVGHAAFLPLLVRALVGHDPQADAWHVVLRERNFNLDWLSTTSDPASVKGSPSNILPRMLRKYRKLSSDPAKRGQALALRQEIGLLLTMVIVKKLRDSVSGRAALGVGWVAMRAMNRLSRADQAVADALGDDEEFISEIETAIRQVVEQRKLQDPDLATRPYREVLNTLKPSIDVDRYFAETDREKALNWRELTKDIANRLGVDEPSANATSRDQQIDIIANLLKGSQEQEPDILAEQTGYMGLLKYHPPGSTAEKGHIAGLRFLMPIAAQSNFGPEKISSALRLFDCHKPSVERFTYHRRQMFSLSSIILYYVKKFGPPPLDVDINHIGIFESAICYLQVTPAEGPGLEALKRFGLWSDVYRDQGLLAKFMDNCHSTNAVESFHNAFQDVMASQVL